MKTLILVDFQNYYLSTIPEEKRKELIKNVIKISRVFMANDWPIIIVQFIDCRQLLEDDAIVQEIQDILSYEKSILVTKNTCDGSTEILDAIDLNKLPLDILIGGVYTDECVVMSIDGLIGKDKNITITVIEELIWPNKNTLIIDDDHTDRIKINKQDNLVLT